MHWYIIYWVYEWVTLSVLAGLILSQRLASVRQLADVAGGNAFSYIFDLSVSGVFKVWFHIDQLSIHSQHLWPLNEKLNMPWTVRTPMPGSNPLKDKITGFSWPLKRCCLLLQWACLLHLWYGRAAEWEHVYVCMCLYLSLSCFYSIQVCDKNDGWKKLKIFTCYNLKQKPRKIILSPYCVSTQSNKNSKGISIVCFVRTGWTVWSCEVRCHICSHAFLCDDLPCSLQHHDCVLPFVRACRGKLNINVWQAAAARVAMATTWHAAHLDACVGCPCGKGFQPRRQGMEL